MLICAISVCTQQKKHDLDVLETARDWIMQEKGAEVVRGVISPVNDGYGKKGLLSAKHRVQMCRLAIQSNDRFLKVDSWESEQVDQAVFCDI